MIRKASGAQVPFDIDKLRASLEQSGAEPEVVATILPRIQAWLRPGMTTRTLYKEANRLLKAADAAQAGRYRLKEALLQLGPSGFPFEQFVAEVFRLQGFRAETSVILQGACVEHEVDVLAYRDRVEAVVECKYHNQRGSKTDVKIPLYVHSRFQDLQKARAEHHAGAKLRFEGWLVTNTRFTDDALRYGACVGLNLMAWDQPAGRGLRERIWETGAHPLTCMGSLTLAEKKQLLEAGIVLCRHLHRHEEELRLMGIPNPRIRKILDEARNITDSKGPTTPDQPTTDA